MSNIIFERSEKHHIDEVDASFIKLKGSAHPKYPDLIYELDYGYLKNTTSPDGSGIDVWIGENGRKADAVLCIVDLMKRDSEIKILIGCTEEEKEYIYDFLHNKSEFMKGILIRR